MPYTLPFKITDEVLNLVAEISELLGSMKHTAFMQMQSQ